MYPTLHMSTIRHFLIKSKIQFTLLCQIKQFFQTSYMWLATDFSSNTCLCMSLILPSFMKEHFYYHSDGSQNSYFIIFYLKPMFSYIWYLYSSLEDKFYYHSNLTCLVPIWFLAYGYIPGIQWVFSKYYLNGPVNVGNNKKILPSHSTPYPMGTP